TGRAEDLFPRHDHLDRPAGLAREGDGNGLEIHRDLAAEAAADFAGNDPDLRGVDAEDSGATVADRERALGAAPDHHLSVLPVPRHAGVRLDVPLMSGRRAELALDDQIGF